MQNVCDDCQLGHLSATSQVCGVSCRGVTVVPSPQAGTRGSGCGTARGAGSPRSVPRRSPAGPPWTRTWSAWGACWGWKPMCSLVLSPHPGGCASCRGLQLGQGDTRATIQQQHAGDSQSLLCWYSESSKLNPGSTRNVLQQRLGHCLQLLHLCLLKLLLHLVLSI